MIICLLVGTSFLWLVFGFDSAPISRITRRIDLKPSAVGVSYSILVHEYIPSHTTAGLTAYIQTSLHGTNDLTY